MKKLTDYTKIDYLVDQIKVEKVYPLSIVEGIQNGEVFVENEEEPSAALIWHYCGFANILGDYNEKFLEQVLNMMIDPPVNHSGRMALHTEEDVNLRKIILRNPLVTEHERYMFRFTEEKYTIPGNMESGLKKISHDNYHLINGRIVPTFSWSNMEAFLKNGFGYCLIENGEMSACAFSSGISKNYVDIGVETNEKCRGKGFGKIVASAMIRETLKRGKIPVWGCDTRNEASMKLAGSVGFEIVGTHSWYTRLQE